MKTKNTFLTAALLVASSVAVNAATQTVNFGISPVFTPTGTVTLTFDNFNFLVGDVESIVVSIDLETSGGSAVLDNDGAAGTYSINFGIQPGRLGPPTDFLVHSAGGASLQRTDFNTAFQQGVNIDLVDSQSGAIGANDTDAAGFQDDGGPDNLTYTLPTLSDSDTVSVASAGWDGYLGSSGTFTISIAMTQFSEITIDDTGTAFQLVPTTVSGSVSVTVVPEPSTYAALFGLAALGLVFARRRR
jgi:hypothetical protein